MMRKYLIAAAALAAVAAPALAAGNYYVGEIVATKTCMVTTTKPDGKTVLDVGHKTWKTEQKAKAAIAKIAACK